MPTFPAFEDTEPPPPSRRARWARAGVAVGVLALLTAGSLVAAALTTGAGPGTDRLAVPSATPSASARAGRPSGILWYDSERLAVADPDGGRPARVSADFATTQQRFYAAVSPDGSRVVTDDGIVVALDAPGLATPQPVVPSSFTQFESVPVAPWADGGERLALSTKGDLPGVAMLTLATGEVELVTAEGAAPAGDPRTDGVAFATGLRKLSGAAPEESFLDTDRVLRVSPNQPRKVLVTKAEVLQRMRLPATTPGSFTTLTFSPDAEHLGFVFVADAKDPGPYGPTVRSAVGVVGRDGGLRGLRPLDPLHFVTSPIWSPAGDAFAFVDFHDTTRLARPDAVVQVWPVQGSRMGDPRPLQPADGLQPFGHDSCAWSPAGDAILCGDHRAWYVLPVVGGTPTVAESVPGRPLAWVGGA
jgi:hypothetical protein